MIGMVPALQASFRNKKSDARVRTVLHSGTNFEKDFYQERDSIYKDAQSMESSCLLTTVAFMLLSISCIVMSRRFFS